MASFPLLNSGSVTQYPSSFATGQAVQVIQFLDGSDQRFLNQGRQLRRWEVNLSLLTDAEIFAIEDFFNNQSGDYSVFSFPDPLTGTDVLNCRLGGPELALEFNNVNSSSTSLWVIETNG